MTPQQLAERASATYYARLVAKAEREGNHAALAAVEKNKENILIDFEVGYLACFSDMLDELETRKAGA